MIAGVSRVNITPETDVWMDGMIREHRSVGVHDPIFARALVLAENSAVENSCAIVSVEVCGLDGEFTQQVRMLASESTGILTNNIIIAATHTHSGPATIGFFNPREEDYLTGLKEKIVEAVIQAYRSLKPVKAGVTSGSETTISHYRRLLAHNGHVVMNWEPHQPEDIVGPLGEIDPEVGVLKISSEENSEGIVCILFNHAGHPNVMSGDNYLISGDYPGLAARMLEEEFGCIAMFINGAQGTMDIDGLRDRDWEGVERTGKALSGAVKTTLNTIEISPGTNLRTASIKYTVPTRKITENELAWAESILKISQGRIKSMADGVGDDYKAQLYKKLYDRKEMEVTINQTCIALGNSVLISFPGELFTEIGIRIKAESHFARTYIIGLANGEIGYVPTRKAISEGGYAVDTREVGEEAEEIIVSQSLTLLEQVYHK